MKSNAAASTWDDSANLLRLWDGTRRTIESFDKSIADIRKIYLALVTAVAAAAGSLSGGQSLTAVLVLSILIVAFTLIFWGLDTHYHAYLKVAANTASRIEARLGLVESHLGVTSELGAYRARGSVTPRIYHLIYLLPGLGASVAFSYITSPLQAVDTRYGILSGILFGTILVGLVLYAIVAEEKFEKFSKST